MFATGTVPQVRALQFCCGDAWKIVTLDQPPTADDVKPVCVVR